ncbi:DUF928 domain-containing protein [Phormidesmis priestleyi ULC007]|uniref:DUF928 domain-containing protein n=1 Tax=Phormidesmis priestleyi ULC007 TaxID=1920490 RepID=A0A2T1D807_9CYAN|nr:DUF928 domain-containing protein [Phormidesmis priestleyi]PSB16630.1 DUF928 domain-containing protein [Phormidesmis priestleyi ULC007]PZO47533.1 MAG: DUF928 domain-containing protein [Phormidesmis priestleyi]
MTLHSHPKTLKFLFSCNLIVCLTISSVAFAAYTPKNPSRPSTATGTTGVRTACGEAAKGMLTALAPLGHVGQTIATHPTFAWYIPDTRSYPIRFSLYSYGSNGKPILQHRNLLERAEDTKGIRIYTLPKDQTSLIAGQKYLWQVEILCAFNDPSKNKMAVAEVEVVAMPTLLQSSLARTSDRTKRANLYAESGFWYDALAEALEDDKAKLSSIALLKDLIKLEAPNSLEAVQKQSDRLKQVIELEQQ